MTTKNPSAQASFNVAPERMPMIADADMTPAQKKAAADLIAGPRKEVKGPFVSLLRSPEFMSRVQKVGEYLRFVCPLDKRINEFAAIIAARHWNQQFEWWAHYRQALEAGLDRSIADAIAEGRRPTGMAEDEEIVYDLLTEVLNNKGASDATYKRAVTKFGEEGVIDVIGVAGYYALLAMVMNVTRTAVPEGPPLPLQSLPIRMTIPG
ncbi:MAG TPA: carboxymuconolactone decarboxylase family protein [Burkholderiales bacterium]|nr:carboxymuconolactone decarboxylase family protein [Burkholderiales bacterium]